jgi:hypothetical protein
VKCDRCATVVEPVSNFCISAGVMASLCYVCFNDIRELLSRDSTVIGHSRIQAQLTFYIAQGHCRPEVGWEPNLLELHKHLADLEAKIIQTVRKMLPYQGKQED